jgi:hypothetical protein
MIAVIMTRDPPPDPAQERLTGVCAELGSFFVKALGDEP